LFSFVLSHKNTLFASITYKKTLKNHFLLKFDDIFLLDNVADSKIMSTFAPQSGKDTL